MSICCCETDAAPAAGMGDGEPEEDVAGEARRAPGRQRAVAQQMAQRPPLDELHDEVRKVVEDTDLEHLGQAGIAHSRERDGLAVHPPRPAPFHARKLHRARQRPLAP